MNAQSPQSPGLRTKSGEEGRFRELVNQQVPRPGPGVVHTTLPGGTVLTPLRTRGRSSALDNFHVTVFTQAGKKKIRVDNGQMGGITPKLDGTALDKKTEEKLPPSLEITGSGTEYVYAFINATHSDILGYVHNTIVVSVAINVFDEIQDDDLAGAYYILLATIVDGVVVRPQPVRTSLSLDFGDDGTASGKAYLISYQT